jgi:DNA-binding FadR family transcriptional regulator
MSSNKQTAAAASKPLEDGIETGPGTRQRVADHVFDALAKAILGGHLASNEPLPTQRELAERFEVSALVVRQAIHRLEDLGLVRVRQGSPTIVLDPRKSADVRLIQLQMELATFDKGFARALLENQVLFVCPLIVLAERRMTSEQLAVLNYIVDSLPEEPSIEERLRFRIEYWTRVAEATGNPLFGQQVRWWARIIKGIQPRLPDRFPIGQALSPDFYRAINASFARGKGTLDLYLEKVRPLLDSFDEAARADTEPTAPDADAANDSSSSG